MPGPSPFADDWRECLIAHYQHVIRNQDQVTERTLIGVLLNTGFTESELAEWKVRATLRADELPPDFVPDLDVLQAQAVETIQQQAAEPEPEATIFEAVALPELAPAEDEASPALPPDEEPPDYRSDAPQQLSLF